VAASGRWFSMAQQEMVPQLPGMMATVAAVIFFPAKQPLLC